MSIAVAPLPDASRTLAGTLTEGVRHFTPNWFAATMGTGGLALVLAQFPVAIPGLHEVAAGLWIANIALFSLFSLIYAARWALDFKGAARVFAHPVQSMFLGAIPMGLATIVNGFVAFGPAYFGPAAYAIADPLWQVDAVLALITGLGVPYLMFTRQSHSLERMTAVWLIPIVAAEVAAASAAQIAAHVDPAHGGAILFVGYVLWAFSVPLAMGVLVVLFLRLALHQLPEREMGPSGWLALGPIGTGALGLVTLGEQAPTLMAAKGLAVVGEAAYGLGVLGGLILWGYGLWWFGLALLKTARYLREGLAFNLGWWAFTFPLAVYTMATLALGRAAHLATLTVLGGVFAAALAAMWLTVAVRTIGYVARAYRASR